MAPEQSPPTSRPRLRLSIGAAVVLALVVLSVAVGLGLMRGQAAPSETVPLTDSGQVDDAGGANDSDSAGELYVHVLGAVGRPGLYVLDLDARVVDAVAAAGGTAADADLAAINLARVLTDGEQIVVPVVGAVAEPGAAPPGDDRIDLNTADQAALEKLPRIGPALAERIIAWREENGRFQSVDDLLAVPGIGEKLIEGLRDGVRV
ncbi:MULTISPECIES: ComEA family DNA-binding protein [unclassified Microbacterium]|uniref:ComEA family DNA-binding protein n=1 Tax=unclassified Microbacterium TaxID=2609290 RepID=UPI000EA9A81B|nr:MULTISPECIES: ComEA family DNA-binding protein [unclassified Microbacterium]MBT2486222.1 ComEA family DNA-binding protein [Microbacterium sp. ISL-108]RKN68942.1 ComEA family DNA-binding protein [Microbacterium sp. CGR2]